MTSDTPDSLRLEVPGPRVAADLAGLAEHLAKGLAAGAALQDWSSVVTSLFGATETIQIRRTEGALAWQLLLSGIGEALADLASDHPPTVIDPTDVDNITSHAGREAIDLLIPVDFLDQPTTLQPVIWAKEALLAWLARRPGTANAQDLTNLGHRFDSAFVLGLRRAIRRDEARYRPLLALRDDPTRPAWQVLEDWRLYRAQLIADFRAAPVFEESFALDQIYVPLNAWHSVKQDSDAKPDPKPHRTVIKLTDDILAWLRGEREDGRLRLISGGPGSGKSSAMKALAADLAERGNKENPTDVLLFPLQRFHWRTGIVESVAATLNAYAQQMRHNPLDSVHLSSRKIPLLIVFDGLDELSASAETSEAISATFLRELSTSMRSWSGRPVWTIVTGRDAIFGNVEGPTTPLPGKRFFLLPYYIQGRRRGMRHRSFHDPNNLLLVDNRKEAFRRFAAATGAPSKDAPSAYRRSALVDVTAQPLLNYFFLTSEPSDQMDGNVARIYSRLFQRLHTRNRNLSNRLQDSGKPGAGLSQEQFDRVFEAMAVACWRTGGSRVANWGQVMAEVRREDSYLPPGGPALGEIFDSHMREAGAQKPFRLAAAFFMRNQKATGVEFTHKSFGDYLYARRLVRAITEMADELRQTHATLREMLARWESLTADQQMSNEVRRFVEFEVDATIDVQTRRKQHRVLAPVVGDLFREGRKLTSAGSMRRAEQRSSQMEEALFVAWHALWSPTKSRRYWSLGEGTGDLLWRALARQGNAHGVNGRSVLSRCMSGADLSETDLSGADFRDADLSHASFAKAQLSFVNFHGADLVGANFREAEADDATFDLAELGAADFSKAFLVSARFRHADLTRATFRHAFAMDTNFAAANLRDADMQKSDLKEANFNLANLKDTNLKAAVLEGSYCEGARNLSAEISKSLGPNGRIGVTKRRRIRRLRPSGAQQG